MLLQSFLNFVKDSSKDPPKGFYKVGVRDEIVFRLFPGSLKTLSTFGDFVMHVR